MSHLGENIHVLLPKRDLALLKKQARRKKVSMGELVRRAVRQIYGGTEPEKKRAVFSRLSARNELEMTDWETVKKDLLKRHG